MIWRTTHKHQPVTLYLVAGEAYWAARASMKRREKAARWERAA